VTIIQLNNKGALLMMSLPNFREFYQRALIHIGENDRLSALKCTANSDRCTHWLLALEGNVVSQETEAYHWKVVVYPTNKKGSCDYNDPLFVSTLYFSFNDAVDYIRKLEKMAQDDQLGNVFSIAN
jgi:hypothetical protein